MDLLDPHASHYVRSSSYKWGFLLWVKVLGAKVAKIKKREKESAPIKMAYY
jgi:hypothetical protein